MFFKNQKALLKPIGVSVVLTNILMAATPATPGPYVGTNNETETSVRISFLDNSTNEDGFKVYIYSNGVLDSTVPLNPMTLPANDSGSLYQYATIEDLTPNTLYSVRVTAFNTDGESLPTEPSSENNGRFRTQATCKPQMPGEYVGVYNVTNTSARISFKDNSDNEDRFKAYVYNEANTLVDTVIIPPKAGSGDYQYANITGLTPNTFYQLKVTAESDACGESEATTASSATNGWFNTTSSTCPAMPGEYVGVYQVTDTSARISFVDNSTNETGFKVYVHDLATNALVDTLTLPANGGIGGYQYATITGLNVATKYKVRVSAFNSDCESDKTQPSSKTNGRFTTLP